MSYLRNSFILTVILFASVMMAQTWPTFSFNIQSTGLRAGWLYEGRVSSSYAEAIRCVEKELLAQGWECRQRISLGENHSCLMLWGKDNEKILLLLRAVSNMRCQLLMGEG